MAAIRCSLALLDASKFKRTGRAFAAVAPRPQRSVRARVAAPEKAAPNSDGLQYDRVLLTILDANPFLSDGSRTAVATAALLARQYQSKVTVLVVDEPGDFADEISADMVVLSSEAVHAKHVDANQLAEFVSCPVLLLP
ncbi:hypothetical protein TSOC_001567 [Tetrabaena socialis]|uniref:UspA domain-containing protein n=1 Tax=Tetrabaena socialis TaxID=47790 RepID=A0A2J8AGE6_9CHLO|nr:hypothetical protein TSOC_001567 [Tetrabaena socialis]|eukprot:PNH11595.1 hypothetical protein TSOC_001567 [Tetrabaena socialis]